MAFAAGVRVTEDELPLQRVYRWERERPHHTFLTQPSGGIARSWNWAQAMDETRRMAFWMKAQKWEPGTRIGILSKNCAWWIMADVAAWMAGHVSVPVYPSLKPETARQILEHSQARACFVGATDDRRAITDGIPNGVECVSFPTAGDGQYRTWDSIVGDCPAMNGTPTRSPDDLATIIYTSGTTGVPKGVMHRFASFSHLTGVTAKMLGLSADDRMLSYLPLAHIVERSGMEMLSLYLGSQIFFTEGVETFLADLLRARPTLFLSVPRLLLKFQQGVYAKIPKERLERLLGTAILNRFVKRRILKQLGLSPVRFAACGAAPLPPEILKWYRGLGLELAEGYGMTEILITHLGMPGHVRAGCVGCALPGVETRLSDVGELLVRSPMNMLGYYRDERGTRDSFTDDGFFRTGDVCAMESDGQLRIIGRLKEQFKTSKGKYVAPSPIESKIAAHPAVEACCLMGAGMPSPFAILVLTPEARERCADMARKSELERSLLTQMWEVNDQLDPHERVAFLAVVQGPWNVSNGLMTPTLKVRRAALESRYQGLVETWEKYDGPIIWEPEADRAGQPV